MKRQRPAPDPAAPRRERRCAACGGALRPSHREYAGRGREATVHRCTACGLSVRGPVRAAAERLERTRRAARPSRPLPDEGPPDNPVLDAEAVRRLSQPG